MKRIQSIIDKVKNCPYTQTALMLQNVTSEEYSKKWHFQTKQNNRLYTAYKTAHRRAYKFEKSGTISVGLYDFEYTAKIGLSNYLYDKKIDCHIWIKTPSRYPKQLYSEDWQKIPLTGKEKDLDKAVKTHLLKYFFDSDMPSVIQWRNNCTKQDVLCYLKSHISAKSFYSFGCIDEDRFAKWAKRKCNVISYVGMEKTASILKKIGKQVEEKIIYGFDFGFAYNFDGNIDELENEFYEANPMSKNVIYV